MVVGASDWSGNHKGAVFVYHNQNGVWSEHSRLTASNRDDGFQYNMYFGKWVAIDGTTIAASARGADHEEIGDNSGAIYIFELDGNKWTETAILEAPNPEAHFGLGYLLAFDGEKLAASGEAGSRGLYLFER
jgi:trimeric autotransporter adhesin